MRLAFCLPGQQFTDGFVRSWTKTVLHFERKGVKFMNAIAYSSNVTAARNIVVGKKEILEREKYDYMMWIDSDTVWDPEDIEKLIAAKKDIISGLVPIDWDGSVGVGNFAADGFLTWMKKTTIPDTKPFEVGYAGMAFMLVRRGIFEELGYPYFVQVPVEWEGKKILYGEDVTWCLRVKELGYKIWAHPGVVLGHQKVFTLY